MSLNISNNAHMTLEQQPTKKTFFWNQSYNISQNWQVFVSNILISEWCQLLNKKKRKKTHLFHMNNSLKCRLLIYFYPRLWEMINEIHQLNPQNMLFFFTRGYFTYKQN